MGNTKFVMVENRHCNFNLVKISSAGTAANSLAWCLLMQRINPVPGPFALVPSTFDRVMQSAGGRRHPASTFTYLKLRTFLEHREERAFDQTMTP